MGTGENLFISWQSTKARKICPEGERSPDPSGAREEEVALVAWAALSHSGSSHSRARQGLGTAESRATTSGLTNQELLWLQVQEMHEHP